MRLDLTENERVALESALGNYLDGIGMDDDDEDGYGLADIVKRLGEMRLTMTALAERTRTQGRQ